MMESKCLEASIGQTEDSCSLSVVLRCRCWARLADRLNRRRRLGFKSLQLVITRWRIGGRLFWRVATEVFNNFLSIINRFIHWRPSYWGLVLCNVYTVVVVSGVSQTDGPSPAQPSPGAATLLGLTESIDNILIHFGIHSHAIFTQIIFFIDNCWHSFCRISTRISRM